MVKNCGLAVLTWSGVLGSAALLCDRYSSCKSDINDPLTTFCAIKASFAGGWRFLRSLSEHCALLLLNQK